MPELRAPLYSLRRHNKLPGCGTVSFNGVGSYILFPLFALQVDDSYDNLVSYKSISRLGYNFLDYAKPRTSARLATVIPPDSDDKRPNGVHRSRVRF